MLEQTIVHVADVLADPRFAPEDVPTVLLASPEELAEAEPRFKFQPDAVVLRPLKAEEVREAVGRALA